MPNNGNGKVNSGGGRGETNNEISKSGSDKSNGKSSGNGKGKRGGGKNGCGKSGENRKSSDETNTKRDEEEDRRMLLTFNTGKGHKNNVRIVLLLSIAVY